MKHKKILLKFLVPFLVCLLALNIVIANNYILVMPGVTRELSEVVEVEGGMKSYKGKLLLTTISTRNANLPLALYALFDTRVELKNRSIFIPQGWSMKEYLEYMKRWMQESKTIAKIVALDKVGIKTNIKGKGVKVVKVLSKSDAYSKIKPGDVILEIDGKGVNIADELIREVQNKKIGEQVLVKVKRSNKILEYNIRTIKASDKQNAAALGLYLTTLDWEPNFPVDVEINTGEIGGPSAGLMFSLEIINQLTPKDLTGGKIIAGTGTINLEGEVGEIGGVRQKVLAAHAAGAQFFLTPQGNYKLAYQTGKKVGIKVIPVTCLDDALNFLKSLALNQR